MTRLVAAKVAENVGQPVVIENRPGGGGQVAAGFVKQAAPDGYTLLVGDIGTHAINASLYSKLTYDPVKDFVPVIELVELPHVLVVPLDRPIPDNGRSRCLGADKPRSADLRIRRRRQRRSPARRTAEVRIQGRHRPRTLSRIVADRSRPDVEPHWIVFRRGRKHGAAHSGGQTSRSDGDGPAAICRCFRTSRRPSRSTLRSWT